MRIIRSLFILLAMAVPAFGATTVLSGSVTDSDGTEWVSGTYTLTFIYDPNLGTPVVNGQAFPLSYSGTLDGTGSFSQSVTSTTGTTPVTNPPISGWMVTVCPSFSSPCYSTTALAVTGASQSVTAQISAVIKAPRITAIGIPQAYADVEVPAAAGNQYYRITDNTFRCYTTSWGECGGGGGGGTIPDTANLLTGGTDNTAIDSGIGVDGGGIKVTGAASANVPNAAILDYFSGNGRLFAFGPNPSTTGGFQVLVVSSDASLLDYSLISGGLQVGMSCGTTGLFTDCAVQVTPNGVASPTFTSTVATGTSPLTVTSTTPVANLSIGGNAATATALLGSSKGFLGALVGGTSTISSASACTPSASCVYSLTNCGALGVTGILSVGTVVSGTSFVINSVTPGGVTVSADTSAVCWKIN